MRLEAFFHSCALACPPLVLLQDLDPLRVWTPVTLYTDIGSRRQGAALVAVDDTMWLFGGSIRYPDNPQVGCVGFGGALVPHMRVACVWWCWWW